MSEVIDLTALMLERRERVLRGKYRIEPDQTLFPIGFLCARLLADARVKMLARRNREAGSE